MTAKKTRRVVLGEGAAVFALRMVGVTGDRVYTPKRLAGKRIAGKRIRLVAEWEE